MEIAFDIYCVFSKCKIISIPIFIYHCRGKFYTWSFTKSKNIGLCIITMKKIRVIKKKRWIILLNLLKLLYPIFIYHCRGKFYTWSFTKRVIFSNTIFTKTNHINVTNLETWKSASDEEKAFIKETLLNHRISKGIFCKEVLSSIKIRAYKSSYFKILLLLLQVFL